MSLPIGFFSPLPLPIMVPFMFMQSAAMALGFGSFFQYGKRKLSAMSNEEFNALTPEALTSTLLSQINNMIPSVQQSFHQMEQMNVMILEAMAKYFEQGVQYLEKWLQGGASNLVSNIQGSDFGKGIGDFLDSGGQLLPSAGASDQDFVNTPPTTTTTKYNLIEKYALKFVTPTSGGGWKTNSFRPTLKEINYLLTQSMAGNMPNIPRSILISLSEREKKERTVPDTASAITASGATGIVEYIATTTATLKALLKKPGFLANTKLLNQFHAIASAYNVKMASTRNPNTGKTYHSLRIDIAATWNKKPLQLRYFT